MTQTAATADPLENSAGQCHQRPNCSDGPKGPEQSGRKSPPFSHRSNESAWRGSAPTPNRRTTLHPAHPPPPLARDRATLRRDRKTAQERHTETREIPTTALSPRPSRDASPTMSQHRPLEGPHTPQHTPAHAARGAQGCGTVPKKTSEATAPPTMTTSARQIRPDAERAKIRSLAAMRARSTGTAQRQQSRTGGPEHGIDEAMTETQNPGSPRPPRLLPQAPA